MNNIHIENQEELNHKIRKFKEDGPQFLHVVSDFDRTLTKCIINGKKTPSAMALIREGRYLTEDYPEKAFALHAEYNPIELNTSLPYDYRFNKMTEWWRRHEKLLIESHMNQTVINDILEKYPKIFREGTLNFLDTLNTTNIPFLILSAGVGNIIERYLMKEKKLYNNTYILSNMFEFDERGMLKGYKDDIIHIMNKSEAKISNKQYLNAIKNRKNILLLGDSIDDLDMIKNSNYESAITIGFLNEDGDEKLKEYISKFDVVITNDGTMDYVNDLLNKIIKTE